MWKLSFNFLILIKLSIGLYAQNCQLPINREEKEFPYRFCNSNQLIWKCTSNPYNEYEGSTWLKPMKFDGCFDYDIVSYTIETKMRSWYEDVIRYFNTIIGYNGTFPYYGIKNKIPIYYPGTDIEITGYDEGDYILEPYETHIQPYFEPIITNINFTDFWGSDCFNYLRFNSGEFPGTNDNFDDALSAWTNLCDGCELNNEYLQHCCVNIKWSKDSELFHKVGFNPRETAAYATSGIIPGSLEPCSFDCDKLYIILNQTDDFTGNSSDDPGNYNRRFLLPVIQVKGVGIHSKQF